MLIRKVHPEFNLSEKVWKDVKDFDKKFWDNRYESIRDFERHLSRNGTKIIKLFLHVSKDEQKKLLLDRINEPDKNWKFSSRDLKERALWDDYQNAYEEAVNETASEYAPWYVLPAGQKWFTRLTACQIITDTLENMNLAFPVLEDKELQALEENKKSLENEK